MIKIFKRLLITLVLIIPMFVVLIYVMAHWTIFGSDTPALPGEKLFQKITDWAEK